MFKKMASNSFPTKNRARFASRQGSAAVAPAQKRAKNTAEVYELVAPSPTLEGLPDDVLLCIMGHLTVLSLFYMSLVCRRFLFLSRDRSVWESVELTQESIGKRVDSQKLKKLIRERLSSSVTRVVVEETFPKKGNLAVTEALLDLLFNTCPKIRTIVLMRCDFTKINASCLLFKSSLLKNVTLKDCSMKMDWLSMVSPSWPRLQSLNLHGSSKTNDRDLLHISKRKRWRHFLRYLNLRGCYRLSLDAIAQACGSLTGLKTLDIRETHHSAEQLQQKLKDLKLSTNFTILSGTPQSLTSH